MSRRARAAFRGSTSDPARSRLCGRSGRARLTAGTTRYARSHGDRAGRLPEGPGAGRRFGSERDGYREIVARLCMGEIGAVFGLEVSRFGRSNADLTRPMGLARLTDTLLIDTVVR
jgi:DNA invertase Pin-like site-specific DNA recombinase